MAFTNNARKKLSKLVQDAKKKLYQEIIDQLQQHFGIFPQSGKVLLVEELTTSDADVIYKAKLLRDRLKYLSSNLADKKNEAVESIEQLIREQAFTILNRLAALRMAEERGIIKETIRNTYTSEGFQVYDSITGQGATATTFIRYKWYLNAIYDELAIDLPSIFDRFSPFAIITPSERTLLEIINLINDEELIYHREEGYAPLNLWQQDETIGWIYQYYNGKDEIKAMRDASNLPRNSRELAVRNQFFTPRYVVQFLTDNSLGKIWFEMTKGKTKLIELCPYLIRNPKVLFLNNGEITPVNPEKDVCYIEHRQIKDPRKLRMLDPACGSMHFGLYAFDLFEIIYLEAWDNHVDLLTDLKNTMTRADFINQIPEYIIRYNIHGVDIDPRALQIAALSLWLRAQKSFDKLGLDAANRPKITKSNLVLAEPMPINADFLSELVMPLDAPIRKLVLEIWELMKLAGETGLLLRIENEIDNKIQEIAKSLTEKSSDSQITIGASDEELKVAEQSARYATKKYRTEFLDNAESKVLDILKTLAENASNGNAYQKLLFADDSARGFAFIELCRLRYDVVLMNPPFGAPSKSTLEILRKYYSNNSDNLYIDFIERTYELINSNGIIGSITDRSFINKKNYEKFRIDFLIGLNSLIIYADLGEGVLDGANVDVAAHLYTKNSLNQGCDFLNLVGNKFKEINLKKACVDNSFKRFNLIQFKKYPSTSFVYDLPDSLSHTMENGEPLSKNTFEVFSGLKSADAVISNRLYWEVLENKIGINNKWAFFQNGSPFSPYYYGVYLVVICDYGNWSNVMSNNSARITNIDLYYKPGLSYGKRTDYMYSYLMKKGCVFSMEGQAVFSIEKSIWLSLLIINSNPYQEIANRLAGQHKPAGYVNPISVEVNKFPEYENEIKKICFDLEWLDSGNEISTSFICPLSLSNKYQKNTFKDTLSHIVNLKEVVSLDANSFRINYNKEVCNILNINYNEKKDRIVDYVNHLYNHDNSLITECNILVSYFLGLYFERWDINNLNSELNFVNFDFFKEYCSLSPGRLINNKNKQTESNKTILQLDIKSDYFARYVENVLNEKLMDKYRAIEILETICEILNCKSIDDYIQSNIFFDFHYSQYSRNRREAPIFWPISTASGSYTIWLYYPKLTEQTLISVINNYLQPKIDDVVDNIRTLSGNSNLDNKGLKDLKELGDLEHELEEMKKELQAISTLPYKPNHDDGVLITAAPLHKLFRHSKWRKSTEECWKELEKGEYDWAHLAYSIWPERVRRKCKKDLSMAIAHGLENICEIKPKEKKVKIKKEPKEIKTDLKLNF